MEEIIPSCTNCKYADLYIPYFTYPFFDPYCSKKHGLCMVTKVCEDYVQIGRLSR